MRNGWVPLLPHGLAEVKLHQQESHVKKCATHDDHDVDLSIHAPWHKSEVREQQRKLEKQDARDVAAGRGDGQSPF